MPLDSQISTERWAHEFRLTSANNEHLEWLVGLYYTKEESSNFQEAVAQPSGFNLVTQGFPADYKEKAAFGNLTYYFTPQLDATVGVRLSSNDMGVLFSGTGFLAGPALPRQTVSDDVQTYLFNARYRPNDDLSLYVRIADGYRPASANLPLLDPATGRDPVGAVRQAPIRCGATRSARRATSPTACSATTSRSIASSGKTCRCSAASWASTSAATRTAT